MTAYAREWRRTPSGKVGFRRSNDQWKASHMDWHRQYHRTYGRDWARAHPTIVANFQRVNLANRRAAKYGVPGRLTTDDIERSFEEQSGRCFYCVKPLVGSFAIDHMKPLGRGGANTYDNIVCTCVECNSKKSTLSVADFIFKKLVA